MVPEPDGESASVPCIGEQTPIRLGEADFHEVPENPGSLKELVIREVTSICGWTGKTELESKPSLWKASSDKFSAQCVCRQRLSLRLTTYCL